MSLTDERYKQLMTYVGMPDSHSLLHALHQAVHEAEAPLHRELEQLRARVAELNADNSRLSKDYQFIENQSVTFLERIAELEQQPRAVPAGFKLVPTPAKLKELLVVGAQIKLGKEYCANHHGCTDGEIITLVEGEFDYDNGLYMETQRCPSAWNELAKEFDSVYHLFENDLSGFMDCEIVTPAAPPPPEQEQMQ